MRGADFESRHVTVGPGEIVDGFFLRESGIDSFTCIFEQISSKSEGVFLELFLVGTTLPRSDLLLTAFGKRL